MSALHTIIEELKELSKLLLNGHTHTNGDCRHCIRSQELRKRYKIG